MDEKEAFSKASALCARQERCASDIEKKLLQWGVEEYGEIISRLKEEKYIDEKRFAGFYVRDKFRFNQWGRKKISWHLMQKQIEREVIEEALNTIDEEEYMNVLCDLLKAKKRQTKQCDPYKMKSSLIRFAGSKGFEYDMILKCLDLLKD